MLIQASEYDLAYGSIYIGFVNRKKGVMYSFMGDNIPVIPNPSYFPKTDNDIKMSSWMETTSNYLTLKPKGYGYRIGNLNTAILSDLTIPTVNLLVQDSNPISI